MSSKMTREEHVARAMLLEAVYVEEGNYYCQETKPGLVTDDGRRFDADTMEPLSYKVAMERLGRVMQRG